jgi:excisionase family DNA binding protein
MESSNNPVGSSMPASPTAGLKLLLSIPEAAALLNVGRSLVYELVHMGAITTLKIGKSRRVPVAALREFIAQRVQAQDDGAIPFKADIPGLSAGTTRARYTSETMGVGSPVCR